MTARPTILLALSFTLLACAPPTSGTVQGIVVEVEGDLSSVTAFTVLVEGDRVRFEPSPAGDFAFPLSHLRDHLRSGEPILVGWELDGERRIAIFLDDA